MRGASLLCGNAEGLWHNAGEAIGQRGPDARVQKEPAHLASHHPFKTRATVSGSCQCAAASASTSQKQHMRGVCMGRAECRGHMHTRCDACVWRAQAPRAHTRVGVRLSEICRTRTLGRSKAAKYGREVLRGGYNTRKMYLRGSFRVKLHMERTFCECVRPMLGCLRARRPPSHRAVGFAAPARSTTSRISGRGSVFCATPQRAHESSGRVCR